MNPFRYQSRDDAPTVWTSSAVTLWAVWGLVSVGGFALAVWLSVR